MSFFHLYATDSRQRNSKAHDRWRYVDRLRDPAAEEPPKWLNRPKLVGVYVCDGLLSAQNLAADERRNGNSAKVLKRVIGADGASATVRIVVVRAKG